MAERTVHKGEGGLNCPGGVLLHIWDLDSGGIRSSREMGHEEGDVLRPHQNLISSTLLSLTPQTFLLLSRTVRYIPISEELYLLFPCLLMALFLIYFRSLSKCHLFIEAFHDLQFKVSPLVSLSISLSTFPAHFSQDFLISDIKCFIHLAISPLSQKTNFMKLGNSVGFFHFSLWTRT